MPTPEEIKFEEQQKLLRAQVPKGTAGATELARQGFTDVGTGAITPTETPQVPQTGLAKVATQGVGPSGEPIFDIFKDGQKLEEPEFAKMGVNVADIPVGQAPTGFKSKFQKKFEQQKAAGVPTEVDASTARSMISGLGITDSVPDKPTQFLQQDEFFNGLIQTFQEFSNPVNQRTSLKKEYQTLIKESGIQEIDLELTDLKRIINETEDSIREEITSAGGTATESQVLALSNARSKQLLKNYSSLIDLRNSKEQYLDTLISLESQDRQAADARFEQSFDMATKIADFGFKMQQQSIEKFDRMVSTIGWNGLLNSVSDYEASLIESAYGLPQGGLRLAAQKEIQAETEDKTEKELSLALKREELAAKPLERQLKSEQIKVEKAQAAKIYADIAEKKGVDKKTQLKKQGTLIQANTVIEKVDEALKQVGGFKVGLAGRAFGLIPGTGAYNLNKTIDTIKSNVGFQALQAMREASPTGGALGQVAVQELNMLQATIASLDIGQSKTQLTKNLKEVKQRFENTQALIVAEEQGLEVTYDKQGNIVILRD